MLRHLLPDACPAYCEKGSGRCGGSCRRQRAKGLSRATILSHKLSFKASDGRQWPDRSGAQAERRAAHCHIGWADLHVPIAV
jgi:hypothetical protein